MSEQTDWAEPYRALRPCADAWRSALATKSYALWWRKCERGDWMLWAMARSPEITQGSQEHVRLCWVICRIWWELSYPWWIDYGEAHQDTRPQDVMTALERWCLDPSAARAAEAAWAAALRRMAEIIREELPEPPLRPGYEVIQCP